MTPHNLGLLACKSLSEYTLPREIIKQIASVRGSITILEEFYIKGIIQGLKIEFRMGWRLVTPYVGGNEMLHPYIIGSTKTVFEVYHKKVNSDMLLSLYCTLFRVSDMSGKCWGLARSFLGTKIMKVIPF